MQNQNLVEAPNGVELSSRSFWKRLSAETCAMSLGENREEADVCLINRNKKNEENLELEVVQNYRPSKDGDERINDASPDSSPDTDTIEASSTWGDFEGFNESKLENVSHAPEYLEGVNEKQTSTNETDARYNHVTTSCSTGCRGRDVFATIPAKVSLSSEDIMKVSFPEVPAPQFAENISSLEQLLDTKPEDAGLPERTKKPFCTDAANLWKTLARSNNPSALRCPWNKSHCQENLLAMLGIDAHRKALPASKDDDSLGMTNVKEKEDSSIDKFHISNCKALIQTKLSITPDSRQSNLFTYNLFLKKAPSGGNLQYITVPQKKRIFTTQSLKLKMFRSNIC